MKDFFISYNSHDRRWAEWIAWHLEEENYSVVIQDWDFTGNWVVNMDRAMCDAQRTIAVLSPQYINALYTQSEWANAFRLDPTGEKDLLIPLRIAPVEPTGILAQIVYTDLVGRSEAEARELLLKRVRGERGKPVMRPGFPGELPQTGNVPPRVVPQKPPYPAAIEDEQRLRRVSEIIVRWRAKYAAKAALLRSSAERARAWKQSPPLELDDEVVELVNFAAIVARDLQALPVSELEFASSYGLRVHPTVFWGQALSTAISLDLRPEERAALEKVNQQRKKLGLPVPDVGVSFDFEMITRVLESAFELTRFDIGNLPRGYIQATRPVSGNLGQYKTLFIVRGDEDPGLQLVTGDSNFESLGSFVARNLSLHALCAHRNGEGSLDLVAEDSQHVYYWERSSPHPVLQCPRDHMTLDALFLSDEPAAHVARIDSHGVLALLSPQDGCQTLGQLDQEAGLKDACIWIDPLDKEAWYVITTTDDIEVRSWLRGHLASTRSSESLWSKEAFREQLDGTVNWHSNSSLALGTLDGLPCLLVERAALGGSVICFLDPKTLATIRQPLVIREQVAAINVAAGHWLVVTLLKSGDKIQNKILVWDLRSEHDHAAGGAFPRLGNVYFPFVVSETRDSFQTLQVFQALDPHMPRPESYQLCRFDWPSCKVQVLKHFSDLRISPVEL